MLVSSLDVTDMTVLNVLMVIPAGGTHIHRHAFALWPGIGRGILQARVRFYVQARRRVQLELTGKTKRQVPGRRQMC
jgi:hypothetical protein